MMNEFETMIRTKKLYLQKKWLSLRKLLLQEICPKIFKILFPATLKELNEQTILVTGASGKIGSQIIKELIDKNFCVIGTYLKKIN